MKKPQFFADPVGFMVCCAVVVALTGCASQQPQPHYQGAYYPPSPRVESSYYVGIRAESDFYEPLGQYGRWEVIGSYGRCWIPSRVDRDWRPYSNGYWQRTDAGWYWASNEPWAWATYHYGRWDLSAQFGWYWVPQTQWAPAWVSWHQGGGYVGWAPLRPSARFGRNGYIQTDHRGLSPRAYVFVEERQFLQPVRSTTTIVNNTTIINKTVNITKIKVVNNTVINEGPSTTVIEKRSGRKVQAVPVRELRRQQEAKVIAEQRIRAPASETPEKAVQPKVRSETERPKTSPTPTRDLPQEGSPSVTTPRTVAPAPAKHEATPAPEAEVERPAVMPQTPGERKAEKHAVKPAKHDNVSDNKGQPAAQEPSGKHEPKTENAISGHSDTVDKPEAGRNEGILKQKGDKQPEKVDPQNKTSKKNDHKKSKTSAKEEPITDEQDGTNTVNKVNGKKGEE